MVRVSTLILFLLLEKKPSAFIIEYDVSCWLVIYKLYYAEVYSLNAQFFKRFIVRESSDALSVCIECVYCMCIWLLFFSLSPSYITLIVMWIWTILPFLQLTHVINGCEFWKCTFVFSLLGFSWGVLHLC